MAGTDNLTLDLIASDPAKAASLAPEVRAALLMRAAAAITALSAGALTAAPPADGQRLLKVPEVAERLRCSRGHVYEMIKSGKLPAIHVGKTRVVREEALRDYLHQHEGGGN